MIWLCCSSSQCISFNGTNCPSGDTEVFCIKISQTIACSSVYCNGVVGNTNITGTTILNPSLCPSTDIVAITNYLTTNVNLSGLDQGYADDYNNCSSGSPCAGLWCG